MVNERVPVSVVIPAHNRAGVIESTLASIYRQTSLPDEVIVVDDGSRDATGSISSRMSATVIRIDLSVGAGEARNVGIQKARNHWIALLDSDDEWVPDHLERLWAMQLKLSARYSPVSFVADSALLSDDNGPLNKFLGNPGPGWRLYTTPADAFVGGNSCMTSGVMLDRRRLDECGGFGRQKLCQDLDTWIRLLSVGTGAVSPAVGFHYRTSSTGQSRNRDAKYAASFQVLDAYREASWFRQWHPLGLRMTWTWSPSRKLSPIQAALDVARAAFQPELRDALRSNMKFRRDSTLRNRQLRRQTAFGSAATAQLIDKAVLATSLDEAGGHMKPA